MMKLKLVHNVTDYTFYSADLVYFVFELQYKNLLAIVHSYLTAMLVLG